MGDAQPTSTAGARGEELGPPTLGTLAAVGQTLAIGPIFSAAFLAGTIAVFAGFNTPLSVLLAGLGAVALAYCIALYARQYAGAGAVYEYLARGVHPALGVAGAGMYLLGLLFLGAGGGFVAEGFLLNNLLAAELSIDIGWWFWSLVSLVGVIAANWIGVTVGIRLIALTALLSCVPLLVIAVVIVAKGGADGNTLAVLDPGRTSWDAVFHGILFAISLFIGFETVASLGEEAKLPRRSIPIALLAAAVIFTLFYLLITYAGTIGFGAAALEKDAWFASGNPFGELGQRYLGVDALGWIVNLAIVVDLLSVLIAFTLAASRLIMVLARDGLLPRALARTSRCHHTPTAGLVAIAAWALLVMLWSGLVHYGDDAGGLPDVLQAILILSASGSLLITLVWLLLAAGALRLVWQQRGAGGLWWRLPVVLVGVSVPVLAYDGALNPFPEHPNDIGVFFAAGSVLVAALWCAALMVRRPDAVRRAAPHATDARH